MIVDLLAAKLICFYATFSVFFERHYRYSHSFFVFCTDNKFTLLKGLQPRDYQPGRPWTRALALMLLAPGDPGGLAFRGDGILTMAGFLKGVWR